MKIFNTKSLSGKLIIALILVVFLSTTIAVNVSYAGIGSLVGGVLIDAICDLFLALGDGCMSIIQKTVFGIDGQIAIDIAGKTSFWDTFLGNVLKLIGMAALGYYIWMNLAVYITAAAAVVLITWLIAPNQLGAITASVKDAADAASDEIEKTVAVVTSFGGNKLPDVTMFPHFAVGPEEIFEGKITAFDINFFHPKEVKVEFEDENGNKTTIDALDYDSYVKDNPEANVNRFYYVDESGKEVETSKQNTALELSSAISKWYYNIRNMVIVFMVLILLYIGIRMMLSSIASEKSKYKKMLSDWVVSMCLVFLLQYIMIFAVNINERIVKIISEASGKKVEYTIYFDEEMEKSGRKENFIKSMAETTGKEYNSNYIGEDGKPCLSENDDATKNMSKIKGFAWITNLMGQARISAQCQDGSTEYVGYVIAYLVLVFYTVFFCFTYIKRVIYMAFLTIIAPFVAMTYSIDKISDGKAQAFNMWLKEYIFNLLIQPMHLILYIVLVSMAFDLAGRSIIYTLVAIGFMMPAEKFVRKMFGFEKAQTPGFLGGAAGAALTMGGVQKLARMSGHDPKEKNKPVEKLDKSKDEDESFSGKGLDFIGSQINEQNGGPEGFGDDEAQPLDSGADPNQPGGPGADPNQPGDPGADPNQPGGPGADPNQPGGPGAGPNQPGGQRRNITMPIGTNRTPRGGRISRIGSNVKRAPRWLARKVAQNQNTIARSIKTGAKLTGAILGAGVGLAAGIASGDISKVGQNMAIGAAAGNSIGANVSNAAGRRVLEAEDKYKETKERYERKKYGEGYSEHIKQQKIDEILSDKDTRRFFANERSRELVDANGNKLKGKERKKKINQMMQQYKDYMDVTGVTDKKLVVKAMKLDRANPTSRESMAALMMAKNAKDAKGIESNQKRLARTVGDTKAQEIADKAAQIRGIYK